MGIGKKEDKLGIRASDTCELYFDNCIVSENNLIGSEGQGFSIAMHAISGGRIGIAAQAVGLGLLWKNQYFTLMKENNLVSQ